MDRTLKVKRHELKYLINPLFQSKLARDLDKVLEQDPNNGIDGYIIRSLYFENYANTDFYDKVDGVDIRKKVRLRIYSCEDETAKLELKRKEGMNQVKESVSISREDANALINLDYEVLKNYNSSVATTLYNIMKVNHLIPVVLIEYNRKAYIHPTNEIRVTLDKNIRASELCFDLFGEDLPLAPIDDNQVIVEVKYNGFIFGWLVKIIKDYDPTRVSFSKYSNSRNLYENFFL